MATRKALCLVSGLFEPVNTPTDKLDFAGNTTTDLTEGTNFYYTDARARASISLSTINPSPSTGLGSLTYSPSTGAFTFTQVTDTVVRGLFSSSTETGITYNSGTGNFSLVSIPNSSLTNSVINILDAFGTTTAVALGNSSAYDIGPAATIIELVRNETGSDIPRGTPVAIVGYSDGRPLVVPANASDPTKMPAIGLAYEMIPTSKNGSVVAVGVAKQIDTSLYAPGDAIYVGTTDGSLVTAPPTGEGNLIQNLGKVTEVAVNGRVFVLNPGRTNSTPNLNSGNIFLGNASNQAVSTTLNTSVVPELTNLYYTDARVRAAISVTDSGGDGSLSYNNTTGDITYVGPSASEVRTHFSVAVGSGLTYNSTTGKFGTNAIPNAQLANSSITVGTTAIALGGSSTTLTGLTSVTSTGINTNDSGFRIRNTSNLTKQIAFDASAISTATTRTYTFPDANGTVLLSSAIAVSDSVFRVQDNADVTKQLAFECSGISTATTRTMTVPDENGTISTQDFATAIAIALG
jgi:hypothetical protein